MSEARRETLMTSVQVLPGPGIVARFGDVLLWMEPGDGSGGSTSGVVGRLLDLARALADAGDATQAGGRVAEVLRGDPQAVPALALLAPTAGGLQAVVHGWGRVLADGVDIDGGWVDRHLAWTTAVAAGRTGDLLRVPTPGSVLDLRRGSTAGGGAAVALAAREASPAPLSAPAPAPDQDAGAVTSLGASVASVAAAPQTPAPSAREEDPAPPFERVDLRATPARREPLPVGGRGGPVAPTSGTTVKGVVCSRGHFNNPIALFCGSCGISMGQITRILQDGIRPSLGTLVLDDGTAYGLDTDHLVGSAPGADPSVAAGEARAVPVADPTGQVAPVHAEVRLVGWDAVLVARAPTFVLAPGSQQWAPAPPGHPNPLPAGARIAIGQRTFVVESNARNSGI